MHAALRHRSMVASGYGGLNSSSGDVANSSSAAISGNDGDDDPGEPPTYSITSSNAHVASIAHTDVLEPIAVASSVYNHRQHHSSTISAAAAAAAAGLFVAEDVALLQDLLLDVPPPSLDVHAAVPPTAIPVDTHTGTRSSTTNDPHSPTLKTEPPVRFSLAASAATTAPVASSTANSPNSVGDSQLKHEPLDAAVGRIGQQAPAIRTADSASSSAASSSSQWLQWDDPHQVLDCAELPNATALELRRLKNRDSMRRSRQRQRDELDTMRATVAQLEHEYEALCLRTPLNTASIERQPSQRTRREHSYVEAIAVAKRLGAENLFLKASIQEHAPWKLQVHRVLESDAFETQRVADAAAVATSTRDADANGNGSTNDSALPPPTHATLARDEMRAIYGFTPLSDAAVHTVILDSTHIVQAVQTELLRSTISSANCVSVFGWDIRRRRTGTEMAFAFVKQFPNASARAIAEKTWDADLRLERFRRIKSETRRLDILQCANANTYVLGRDVRSPDSSSVFRTVYLRFRMETTTEVPASPTRSADQPHCRNQNGFVIGTQSINPSGVHVAASGVSDHETLEWADMTLWMEFVHVRDAATGRDVCEVRWSGRTDYKSEAQAYRSAADTLLGLLRWEALAIAPVLRLC